MIDSYKNKLVITVAAIRPDVIRFESIFRKLDETFTHLQVHSGQHFDFNLRDEFYQDLDLRAPDYILSSGAPNRPHYIQQGECGKQLIELIYEKKLKPDAIIFLGDSNSVLASIPLRKEFPDIKICHVEALMRSFHSQMSEEWNRICCDRVSDILFTYHENYKKHGLNEGIAENKIFVVGNSICEPLNKIKNQLIEKDKYWANPYKKHIIMDIHRPENFKHKSRMIRIFYLANKLSKQYNLPIKMLEFGRTFSYLKEFDLSLHDSIQSIPLMGYVNFIKAQLESKFIISDSGTSPEENSLLKVPVLVPRDYTERPEAYENNNAMPIYLEKDVDKEYDKCVNWLKNWNPANSHSAWLGDGTTSQKIIDILKEKL